MGYSYSAKAGYVLSALVEIMHRGHTVATSNSVPSLGKVAFYEHGREQSDGSITGTVWKGYNGYYKGVWYGDEQVKRAGGFKIDAEGHIVRFPGTTKKQKREAETVGLKAFEKTYMAIGSGGAAADPAEFFESVWAA